MQCDAKFDFLTRKVSGGPRAGGRGPDGHPPSLGCAPRSQGVHVTLRALPHSRAPPWGGLFCAAQGRAGRAGRRGCGTAPPAHGRPPPPASTTAAAAGSASATSAAARRWRCRACASWTPCGSAPRAPPCPAGRPSSSTGRSGRCWAVGGCGRRAGPGRLCAEGGRRAGAPRFLQKQVWSQPPFRCRHRLKRWSHVAGLGATSWDALWVGALGPAHCSSYMGARLGPPWASSFCDLPPGHCETW